MTTGPCHHGVDFRAFARHPHKDDDDPTHCSGRPASGRHSGWPGRRARQAGRRHPQRHRLRPRRLCRTGTGRVHQAAAAQWLASLAAPSLVADDALRRVAVRALGGVFHRYQNRWRGHRHIGLCDVSGVYRSVGRPAVQREDPAPGNTAGRDGQRRAGAGHARFRPGQ